MKKIKVSIKAKIAIFSIFSSIATMLVIGAINIRAMSRVLEGNTSLLLSEQVTIQEQQIDAVLSGIENSVVSLSQYLCSIIPSVEWLSNQENEQTLTESMYKILENAAKNTPETLTAYIRYNPDFTNPTSGLFLTRNSNTENFQRVPPTDFSMFSKDDLEHVGWYYIPVNNGKPTWMEPYLNQNINVMMISYVVPLFLDGKSIGILGMDLKTNVITNFVENSIVKESGGYAFLTDVNGKIYNHPTLSAGTMLAELSPSTKNAVHEFSRNSSDSSRSISIQLPEEEKMCMAFTTLRNGMKISIAVPETQIYSQRDTLIAISGIATIILAVLITFQSFIIGKSIASPVIKTTQLLKEISQGQGDLTKRLEINSKDEAGDLALYFNTFMDFLHDMISKVKDETGQIDTIKDKLKEGTSSVLSDVEIIATDINDLNFQTEEQSASVEETSSALQRIVDNIEKLSEGINDQSAAVTQSSAAIQQMISNINSIATNLNKTAASFNQLKDASTEGSSAIGNVQMLVQTMSGQSAHLLETNSVINSIAEQTNLLAMNAAIEAAHAGEAGKGFAVVADEIRKLAENSATQSKDIAKELNAIVTTINTIVDATSAAETSFTTVMERISMVSDLVSEISSAMSEQNEGSRQVLEALQNIQGITIDIQSGSQDMNSGTTSILNEMSRLKSVSQKVQTSSQEMARAVETISLAISQMESNVRQNGKAVQSLNDLTQKFVL